ncbi:hypothetical protein Tco_1353554 [Tanacetum coccineum]
MEETLSKFMRESAKRHKENSNLIKEIRASTDAAIHNQRASIKTLEIQIGQMSMLTLKLHIPRKEKDPGSFTLPCFINNVCFDNVLVDLGASVSIMPLLTYLNLGLGELAHTKLKVELADKTMKYPKGIAKNVLVGIGKFVFPVDFIILDMPKDIKVPLILGRPFLSTPHAKIDVYKRKIILRVREERIVFTSVKPGSSLIKRVYMLSLGERMELDLEARLMGETLVWIANMAIFTAGKGSGGGEGGLSMGELGCRALQGWSLWCYTFGDLAIKSPRVITLIARLVLACYELGNFGRNGPWSKTLPKWQFGPSLLFSSFLL